VNKRKKGFVVSSANEFSKEKEKKRKEKKKFHFLARTHPLTLHLVLL
jgi:hypothetical protein